MAMPSGPTVEPDSDAARPVLLFELDGQGYALRFSSVSGVADPVTVRPVPGAPSGVLGLAHWRGELLTVLDLPRILENRAHPAQACLVRLAPPLEGVALHLPASLRVGWAGAGAEEPEVRNGAIDCGGRSYRLLDPTDLLERTLSAQSR
jgi:hypothetical protein